MSQQQYGYPPAPGVYNMQPVAQQGVTVVQAPVKPENHMIFSIFVCLCCNWICGLLGIYHSSQVNSTYAAGDYNGAASHSRQAKQCNIIGLIFGIISIVVGIIFIIVWYTVLAAALVGAAGTAGSTDWNDQWT